jgi:hypothetical protein
MVETLEEELPDATPRFADCRAMPEIPFHRRNQLRVNRVISSSPPLSRWLLSNFAEPTCEVHQPVRQGIGLPERDSSEPLIAIFALVRLQDRENVDTDGFAIRSVRVF